MAYPFIIIPDIEEGVAVKQDDIRVAFTEEQVKQAIRNSSNSFPNATILVYELRDMYKIKRQAEYQKYVRNPKTGEIVPE